MKSPGDYVEEFRKIKKRRLPNNMFGHVTAAGKLYLATESPEEFASFKEALTLMLRSGGTDADFAVNICTGFVTIREHIERPEWAIEISKKLEKIPRR